MTQVPYCFIMRQTLVVQAHLHIIASLTGNCLSIDCLRLSQPEAFLPSWSLHISLLCFGSEAFFFAWTSDFTDSGRVPE